VTEDDGGHGRERGEEEWETGGETRYAAAAPIDLWSTPGEFRENAAMEPHRSVHELFGAPPPATTGRERLLSAAIDLFSARGFHAVGLDQVIARAGVTKTTFYKHFESKDELMLEAVRMRDAWEMEAWGRAARSTSELIAMGGATSRVPPARPIPSRSPICTPHSSRARSCCVTCTGATTPSRLFDLRCMRF